MQRLRKRAERYLKRDATSRADPDHDVQRLNRGLRVHQVELELQNEELRRAKYELEAVLNERISFYRALNDHLAIARAKGLRIGCVASSVNVIADPLLLYRIITNLVSDAVRYTDLGGVIVGGRRDDPGRVRIEVLDAGSGIAPRVIKRIYDEFWQADNPERNIEKGLGLRLTITRRRADELVAALNVRSIPGRGSVFALTLPISAHGGGQP